MEWNTRLGLTESLLTGRTATFWSRVRGKRQGTETLQPYIPCVTSP